MKIHFYTIYIGLHVNADKTEYMRFNQSRNISTLNDGSLKIVDKFDYLGSSIASMENDHNIQLAKLWTAINRLLVIWESDLSDKIKLNFFQAVVMSIQLYGCTTWTLIKRIKKKLDGNCIRMQRAISNKSWKQHPTEQQLYGHLSPISKTIQIRWTRYVGCCWRSKDKHISNILHWTPSHGCASVRWPARTYLQQLCTDTGCSLEDLP